MSFAEELVKVCRADPEFTETLSRLIVCIEMFTPSLDSNVIHISANTWYRTVGETPRAVSAHRNFTQDIALPARYAARWDLFWRQKL